jgi:hypothetical protein
MNNENERRTPVSPDPLVMDYPLHSLADKHGIFLRRDALAAGHNDRALARALRAKVIHRVRQGAYVSMDQWLELDRDRQHLLRAMAVLRTAGTALALSHVTALIKLGAPAWDLSLDDVHVTRLDGRAGRREAGVAQHCGRIHPGDVIEIDGTPVTSATRTAVDLTMTTDVEHALPAIDHLLHTKATDKVQLRARAQLCDVWPGTLATDLAIRLADERIESVGESRSSYMFWRGGLPKPEPQYKVRDEWGHIVARVDFAWPEYGVFLEFDGKTKYQKYLKEGESELDAILREKKREENICRLTGWRCIRIVWADLYRPQETVTHIRSVLAGGTVH